MSSNQDTALAPQAPVAVQFGARGMELNTLDELFRFARYIAASPFKPRGFETPEAIVVAIAYGRELNLAPLQSLQNIAVINGKPSIYGDAMLAVVRASGLLEYITETYEGEGDDFGATCRVKRVGSPQERVERFTMAMAKRGGLLTKQGPWQTSPERMLRFRARGFALRDEFGDCLKGLISAEEAQDYPAPTERNVTPIREVEPPAPVRKNAITGEQLDLIAAEECRTGKSGEAHAMGRFGLPVEELQNAQAAQVLAWFDGLPTIPTEDAPTEGETIDADTAAALGGVVDEPALEPVPFDDGPTTDEQKDAAAAKRREDEGRAIAAMGGVTRDEAHKRYEVRSGKERQAYRITKPAKDAGPVCNCPDFKFNGEGEAGYRCKHLWAVYYHVNGGTDTVGPAKVSEHDAANLRAAFQERGVPPAEWLQAHGVASGLCEDASVDVFNEAMAELYIQLTSESGR